MDFKSNLEELLSEYFFIDTKSPLNEDFDLPVFRVKLKPKYNNYYLSSDLFIIKTLSKKQTDVYKNILNIWSPYLESIYQIIDTKEHIISINEYIKRPTCLDYSNYDSMHGTNEYSSLSLRDYINPDNFTLIYGANDNRKMYLNETVALQLLYQMCLGLDSLYKGRKNFIHGDIAPQNILLTDNPNFSNDILPFKNICPFSIKIIDFGATQEIKNENHEITTVIGTPYYTAPDKFDYSSSSKKVDIYSLGCILHCFITSKSPAESGGIRTDIISKEVCEIIQKCNADYKNRYESMEHLENDILRVLMCKNSLYRIVNKLPGYRTHKIWKMLVVSLVNFFYILYICSEFCGKYEIITRFHLILSMFVYEGIFFDIFKLFDKISYLKKRLLLKILAKIFLIIIYEFIFLLFTI